MKRAFVSSAVTVALIAAATCLTGCDKNPAVAYDPHVDGLTPISHDNPDMSILENQATLYAKMRDAGGARAGAPATAPAAAPASAPAAEPSAPAAPPPPPAG